VNAGPARPPYNRIPEEYAEGARLVGRKYAALQEKYSKIAVTVMHMGRNL